MASSTQTCFRLLIILIVVCFSSSVEGQEVNKVFEFFQSNVGEWDATWEDWGTIDHKTPAIARGVVKCSVFGDYWLINDSKFDHLEEKLMLGCNSKDLTVEGFSVLNLLPNIDRLKGKYDTETKTLKLSCVGSDVISGEKTESKIELKMIDANNRIYTSYAKDVNSGKYFKCTQITMKRKNKGPAVVESETKPSNAELKSPE